MNLLLITKRIDDRFAEIYNNKLQNPNGGLTVIDDVVDDKIASFFLVA